MLLLASLSASPSKLVSLDADEGPVLQVSVPPAQPDYSLKWTAANRHGVDYLRRGSGRLAQALGVMGTASRIFVALLAAACADAIAQDQTAIVTTQTIRREPPQAVELDYAIIQFKRIAVPSVGTVQSAAGNVDRFTWDGWVPLHVGDVLENGARFQLEAGASAKIRFSANRVVEFSPQQEVRGFEVQVHAGE